MVPKDLPGTWIPLFLVGSTFDPKFADMKMILSTQTTKILSTTAEVQSYVAVCWLWPVSSESDTDESEGA